MRSTGLELAGAWNFRDVAEETDIAPGRLFRSSELSGLVEDGRKALQHYGITDVADLRSRGEVARRGAGQVPDGVRIHLLPFHLDDDANQDAPHENTFQRVMSDASPDDDVAESARRYMTEVYQEFPTLPGTHAAILHVISMLAGGDSVIAHCFAGKDRTGFTIATVLGAIGVGRDAIMADFLRSNAAVPGLRERIMESIRARAGDAPEVIPFAEARLTDEVLGVREEYLDTALRVVDAQYGSLSDYLAAIEVSDDQLKRLRCVLMG